MKSDFTGLLDIKPQGADKLRVDFSVTNIRAFDLTGSMKPKAKDGNFVPDLKAKFLTTKGAHIVDLLGDTNKAATKALPENAPKKEGAPEDEFNVSGFGSFLGLPELQGGPRRGQAGQGLPRRAEESSSAPSRSTWRPRPPTPCSESTTAAASASPTSQSRSPSPAAPRSSARAAEHDALHRHRLRVNLTVNLDDMLPVRAHIESTTSFSAGAQGGGESRIVMDATYEPGT